VQEEDAVAQLVSQLRTSQRAWVRSRNTCKSAQCLEQSYERRIAELACMDGPALASAIGVSTCASAALRRMDHELVARDPARAQAWKHGALHAAKCLKKARLRGRTGCNPALQCGGRATQERLARR
jgi:uncharacterized protein